VNGLLPDADSSLIHRHLLPIHLFESEREGERILMLFRRNVWRVLLFLPLLALLGLLGSNSPEAPAQDLDPNLAEESAGEKLPPVSGVFDLRDAYQPLEAGAQRSLPAAEAKPGLGTNITECPQGGLRGEQPLDRRARDRVEQLSNGGDDVRVNQDRSCFPQNETSIAVNPTAKRNLLAGANDYRLGFGSSGFYASTDGGTSFYDGVLPFPTLPNGDNLDGGGDPAIAFDRDGVGYYAEINFNRTDDTNGIFVLRSTNGGFTWSRPCVPIDVTPADPTDDQAACGGTGDPRQPGDNVVTFQQDNDALPNGSVPFNDKEYIAVGPRPEGVDPQCFGPTSGNEVPCNPVVVSSDRIYVTWTKFTATDAQIYVSYSDDEARSWSPEKAISGSAAFCIGVVGTNCDLNQFSTPTVNPTTGFLYVAFENFNTEDENQYLLARSRDGGNSFEGPFFVTPVFDVNYPRSGSPPAGNRPDCAERGQQDGRAVLTNSCFRVNSAGNVVVDSRGGDFADDLYLVLSDNRSGTSASTNTDVFLFKSTDGGSTWVGPTRVNDDRSDLGDVDRDGEEAGNFGNDQWFPWADIGRKGELNVVFHDRRLDEGSEESEWPESRSRPGNYLAWFWGAQCSVTKADSRQCVAPEAEVIEQPTAPVNPGSGSVPGQHQENFPLKNFGISDVPSNMDYSFRAGIFMGDYNNVAVSNNTAYGFWTDARNGRSSRDQFGRNPACEQSDVFLDDYGARNARSESAARPTDDLFLRTECAGARGGAD
jgi:hypothetical protein